MSTRTRKTKKGYRGTCLRSFPRASESCKWAQRRSGGSGGAQESPIEENQSTVHRGDSGRYEVGTPDVWPRDQKKVSKAKHSGLRTLRKSLSRVVSFSDFSTPSDDMIRARRIVSLFSGNQLSICGNFELIRPSYVASLQKPTVFNHHGRQARHGM